MARPVVFRRFAILAGCGAVALACGGLQRQRGVMVSNTLDGEARAELAELELVEEGEEILAFYDASLGMDGSKVALITDRRLVTALDGYPTATDLADIASVEHTFDVVGSDRYLVSLANGGAMEVIVAPMNGGDLFGSVLERARSARAAGVAPSEATPED